MVTNHGYHCVGIAISYDKAIEYLETETIDLVLLDINISGERSGLDVAQTINQSFHLPFLFLTSYTDQGQQRLSMGLNGHLVRRLSELCDGPNFLFSFTGECYKSRNFKSLDNLCYKLYGLLTAVLFPIFVSHLKFYFSIRLSSDSLASNFLFGLHAKDKTAR